jgi:hypothetical protein
MITDRELSGIIICCLVGAAVSVVMALYVKRRSVILPEHNPWKRGGVIAFLAGAVVCLLLMPLTILLGVKPFKLIFSEICVLEPVFFVIALLRLRRR